MVSIALQHCFHLPIILFIPSPVTIFIFFSSVRYFSIWEEKSESKLLRTWGLVQIMSHQCYGRQKILTSRAQYSLACNNSFFLPVVFGVYCYRVFYCFKTKTFCNSTPSTGGTKALGACCNQKFCVSYRKTFLLSGDFNFYFVFFGIIRLTLCRVFISMFPFP